MAAFPIGKDHDPRPRFPDHTRDLDPVLPAVLDSAVGDIKRTPPTHSQNLCRRFRFTGAIFGGPARSHLALRQIKNSRTLPALRGFQKRAAASLLYIVAVRRYSENIERAVVHI